MTSPAFDPLNPPTAAIGLRPGMFGDSFHCPNPTCGFASSAQDIYECPSCNTPWRKRPVKAETPNVLPVGTQMALVCALCGNGFDNNNLPVFDGNGLSHAGCLNATLPPKEEADVADYLAIVKQTQPKKKRRRRRKKRPSGGTGQKSEALTSTPEGEDTQDTLF